MSTFDYASLEKRILDFVQARKWEAFHSPKNLSMALNVEAAELLEIFQWMSEEESKTLSGRPDQLKKVEEELADIVYYVMLLSSKLGVNLEKAMLDKMKANEEKYPIEKSQGTSKKYTEF